MKMCDKCEVKCEKERRIDMREIESLIRQALAIEMLEYEDKNHLSGNDKSRSETKIELLSEAMQKIKKDKIISQSKYKAT